MTTRLRAFAIMVIVACAVAWPDAIRPSRVRTVLAVFWSSEEFPSSVAASRILRDTFQGVPDLSVDFFAEYFESDRFKGAAYEDAFRDYLVRKYDGRTIDVVIAQTDAVLRFFTRYRAELFPEAAIVHSGVSAPDPEASERGAGITSVMSAPAIHETLALALRLHPEVRRVHVIAHVPDGDGRTAAIVRSGLREFEPNVRLEYPQPSTIDDLLGLVRSVPPAELILYVRWSSEVPGHVVSAADAASLVGAATTAPVYTIAESSIGSGAVGGAVYSYEEVGRRLADAGLQVLRGVRAQDIPDQRLAATPMFDAQQLDRWRIEATRLPAGSRIINRDVNNWARYRWYIAGAIGFAAVEALMIGTLVLQRSRRRDTEARNQAILRCVPDLMFLQNADDGVFLDYHARDPRSLLLPPEEFLGRSMHDVLPPGMAQMLEQKFEEVFASPDPEADDPVTMEYELPMPDGPRTYEARLVACDGRRVLSIVRDITDRRRGEESLRRTQEELATASRLSTLGEFAASIAHELNQPLAVVTMNSNLSLRWTADGERRLPQIRAALQDVVAAAARATDVVRHARKVYQHRRLEVGSIDIAELIAGVCHIVKRRIKASAIVLELDVTPGLVASGDIVALKGVLLNLVLNAIEAMEQVDRTRRQLTIRSHREPAGSIEVVVSDSGPGVSEEIAERIFRTGHTTKPDGMGIGLSTSRAIIEALGGRIWVMNKVTGGATFTFTIPADAATGPDTRAV